jgi:hypothetical protein
MRAVEFDNGAAVAGGIIAFEFVVTSSPPVTIDGDCLVDAAAFAIEGTTIVGAAYFANQIEVPKLGSVGGAIGNLYVTDGAFYGVAALWGPANITARVGGDVGYNGNAVSALLNTGGLTIDASGVASSYNLTTGLWTPGIAISQANLDLAVAGGGFGGVAYGIKGTKIRQI